MHFLGDPVGCESYVDLADGTDRDGDVGMGLGETIRMDGHSIGARRKVRDAKFALGVGKDFAQEGEPRIAHGYLGRRHERPAGVANRATERAVRVLRKGRG